MRKENNNRSEMVSQLLYGDCFKIIGTKKEWLQITTLLDSYTGWIDNKQSHTIEESIAKKVGVETPSYATQLIDYLEKFKKMIYSKSYQMLIKHENNEITILSEDANRSVYKVYILSSDKKRYSYIWQIEKVQTEGNLKDCWMTTAVSTPMPLSTSS